MIFQEREFYAKMPSKILNEKAGEDEFILQGIVDLAVVHGDEIWILDYKTGRFSDSKYQKYKFQVDIYAEVFEKALSKKAADIKRCTVMRIIIFGYVWLKTVHALPIWMMFCAMPA